MAAAATTATGNRRAFLTVPITKVDADTRTVEGYATVETPDGAGEIMDYEAARDVIKGTWPGNIREMHQLKAVGTGVVVECDDDQRAVKIRATISKGAPDTWTKIQEGVLKAFSIGGRARVQKLDKAA